MEKLQIDTGAVEVMINDDPDRVIRFYPNDVGFAEAYFGLIEKYQTKQKEIVAKIDALKNSDVSEIEKEKQAVILTREMFKVLREGIDKAFGDGASQAAFGDRDSMDMAARFFKGITPIVRKARMKEIEKYTEQGEQGVLE